MVPHSGGIAESEKVVEAQSSRLKGKAIYPKILSAFSIELSAPIV
jgi:hypothetical protein